MSKFINKKYKNIEAYVPGEQPTGMQYIKLNTNESPYPPSPSVIQAVDKETLNKLQLYPDPECTELREKLAGLYGVKKENIYLANGSDDILNFAFMAFSYGKVYFPEISYGFYKVFAELNCLNPKMIPLNQDFSISFKDYCALDDFIVIANPNAPTGIALSVCEIEEIVKSNKDHVVLIDEAYVDFGAESCCPLIEKYDNLMIVQTFSKSRSMAGARLGFAIADKDLIKDLEKIKYSTNPYNINRMTLAAGEAAVRANDYYMNNCRKTIEVREYTVTELEKLGFSVIPSQTNFVFARTDKMHGCLLYKKLKQKGVLVRNFSDDKISDYNRITIGTKEQMQKFIQVVKTILEGV